MENIIDAISDFFSEEEQEVQGAVNGEAESLEDLKELAAEYARLHAEKKRLEVDLDDVKKKISQVDSALVMAFENAGIEKQARMKQGLFTKDRQEYVSIVEEMEKAAFDWLTRHGAGWMIKPSVHPQRLRSFVIKERDEQGEEIPECFKVSPVTRIKFTPKKSKKE